MREELSEKYVLSKKRNWPKMESQGITFQGCTGKPTKKTGGKKKKGQKSVNRVEEDQKNLFPQKLNSGEYQL